MENGRGGGREGGRKRSRAEEVRQGRRKPGREDERGREGGRMRGRTEEERVGPSNEAEE